MAEIRHQGKFNDLVQVYALATADGGCVRIDVQGARTLNLPPEIVPELALVLTIARVAAMGGHDGRAIVEDGVPKFIPGDFAPEEPGSTGSDTHAD